MKKHKNFKINKITFDQDNSLIIAATNRGYRIYETTNYSLVNDVDDYQDIIGDLKSATTLFKSQVIAFVGNNENPSFPTEQFVLWDDMRKLKIGMIILKNEIIDFKLTKNAIFISISNKILMFELISLKFVHAIEDVHFDPNKTSLSVINDAIVLAHSSSSNKSMIKINKYLVHKNHIASKLCMMIITTFEGVQCLAISNKGDYVVVFSKYGNKAHIYSIEDFQLKFCLFLSENENIIHKCVFDYHSRFFAMISYDGYSSNLILYDLKMTQVEDSICECEDDDDDHVRLIVTEQNSSFIGSIFNRITKKIFSEKIPFTSSKLKLTNHEPLTKNYFNLAFNAYHKDLLV